MKTKNDIEEAVEFDPNQNLYWSTRRILFTIIICTALSLLAVFGFLVTQQYRQAADTTDTTLAKKAPAPDTKQYSNQYWGIEFYYPGTWTQPIGSYEDGVYYFSSQNINFATELDSGEALIALKTYNNWQSLPYEDWFKANKYLFIPNGDLSTPTSTTINGVTAEKYTVTLKKPENNTNLWGIVVISRSTATKYVFILETDSKEAQDKFLPIFNSVLSSINFTAIGNNPNGK